MRTLTRMTAAAGLVAATLTTATAPAGATDPGAVQQLCVDFPDNGTYTPHLAEDYETWEAVRGHRVAAFPNSPVGCGGIADGVVWDFPNPYAEPAADPTTCEPKVVEVPVTVERRVEVESPAARATIDRQARKLEQRAHKIERQAKRIATLRHKLKVARQR